MLLFFFFLLLHSVTSIDSNATEQHAVVHARLDKSLFVLASTTAKKIIGDEVPKIPLPAINEKFAGIRVRSRWVRWDGFQAPSTNFTISESGLRWDASGGMVKIKISFVAKWFLFTVVGTADFQALDLGATVQATIRNSKSRPQIEVRSCASTVRRVRVRVHADIAGFFLNLFRKFIENALSDTIRKETCKTISRLVVQGNKFVMAQPEEIPIWNTIALNYTVVGEPSFRRDAIEATSAFRLVVGNFTDADDDNYNYSNGAGEDLIESMRSAEIAIRPTIYPNHSLQDVFLYSAALVGVFNLLANFRKQE